MAATDPAHSLLPFRLISGLERTPGPADAQPACRRPQVTQHGRGGAPREAVEVAAASTVRGAETGYRAGPGMPVQRRRPGMFEAHAAHEPDPLDGHLGTQVVDMPAPALRTSQVAADPGAQAAGSERAADVAVPSRTQHDTAVPADLQRARLVEVEPEQVAPRGRRQSVAHGDGFRRRSRQRAAATQALRMPCRVASSRT